MLQNHPHDFLKFVVYGTLIGWELLTLRQGSLPPDQKHPFQRTASPISPTSSPRPILNEGPGGGGIWSAVGGGGKHPCTLKLHPNGRPGIRTCPVNVVVRGCPGSQK